MLKNESWQWQGPHCAQSNMHNTVHTPTSYTPRLVVPIPWSHELQKLCSDMFVYAPAPRYLYHTCCWTRWVHFRSPPPRVGRRLSLSLCPVSLPQVRQTLEGEILGEGMGARPPGCRPLPISPAGHRELHLGGGHSGRHGVQIARRRRHPSLGWAGLSQAVVLLGRQSAGARSMGLLPDDDGSRLALAPLSLAPSSRDCSRARWQHVCLLGEERTTEKGRLRAGAGGGLSPRPDARGRPACLPPQATQGASRGAEVKRQALKQRRAVQSVCLSSSGGGGGSKGLCCCPPRRPHPCGRAAPPR